MNESLIYSVVDDLLKNTEPDCQSLPQDNGRICCHQTHPLPELGPISWVHLASFHRQPAPVSETCGTKALQELKCCL